MISNLIFILNIEFAKCGDLIIRNQSPVDLVMCKVMFSGAHQSSLSKEWQLILNEL